MLSIDSFLLRLGRGSNRRSGCRQRVHGSSNSGSMSDRHLIGDTRGRSKDVNLEFVLASPTTPVGRILEILALSILHAM